MISSETLLGISIFKNLKKSDREAILHCLSCSDYDEGNQIVSHKNTQKDVYFVINGEVRVTIYSLSGKQVSFRDLQSGEMFGELSAIDSKPRSAHVVALKPCRIAKVSQHDFLEILHTYPQVNEYVLHYLTSLVRDLSDRVFDFSSLAVTNRVHAELLRLALESGSGHEEAIISPAPKHADIASRISTHREAVSRVFNELIKQGLLEKQPNAICIKNIRQLENMVNEVRDN